jgi:hypothetical protein
MAAMSDLSDTASPKRRRAPRKTAGAPSPGNVPAVQAIIDQAMHPEVVAGDPPALMEASAAVGEVLEPAPQPTSHKRTPRRRIKSPPSPPVEMAEAPSDAEGGVDTDTPIAATAAVEDKVIERTVLENTALETAIAEDVADTPPAETGCSDHRDDGMPGDPLPAGGEPPDDSEGPIAAAAPAHHHWVYLGLAVFLLSLGFGVWGAWTTFFADAEVSDQSALALRARSDKLSQEVSTLRRSDQISREANRDLERTLAERDEEIAGLRADIAFYERFVGATGQRRGLSVHDLDLRLQSSDAWHFVATLTQNLNRGAVNSGRVTLSVEGTRGDRLEKLSWSNLRKQSNAPGVGYSFKYFQQVEGEVILPKDFKPLRVTVRLVPTGGSAVEQSFPWPDTVRAGEGG